MYVVSVAVQVRPEFVGQFIEATLDNARHSRQEKGNVRFDVNQSQQDPSQFMLYEAYLGPDELAQHHQSAHYLKWREAVAPWMAGPRQGTRYSSLFFGDSEV